MGYHFSSRLTAALNLCLIYFKITWALAILLEHMHKKFEINPIKIKDGCQSGRRVVTHNFKSDLLLVCTYLDHTRWHDDILTPFSWRITFSPLWQSMKTSSSVNWWTRKIRPTAFALFSKTLGRFFFCVLDNSLYNKLRGNEEQLHIFFLFN